MSLVKNNLRWPYCIPLFVLCVKILVCAGVSSEVSFDFSTLTLGSLKLLGDAHLNNGSIRLSRDLPVPNSGAGRALFADPVRLRHPTTGAALPFSTFFSFTVANLNPSSIGGGLAFLITSDDSGIGDPGGFLGLISRAGGGPGVVAVEFDTLMDVEFDDINGNHVGVDINSMVSEQVVDLTSAGIDFKSGNLVNVWIDYDRGVLQVSISYSNVRPESSIIAFPVDLAKYVDDLMFVGFSGSTQGSTEIHNIEWWSFSSSLPTTPASPPPPPFRSSYPVSPKNSASSPPSAIAPSFSASIAEGPSNGSIVKSPSSSSCQSNNLCRQGPAAVAGVATAGAFFIVALAAMGIWAFHRKSKSPKKWDGLVAATEILKTPREFSYNELVAATGGFSSARIIGHGAFGTVYKGIILETGAMVAVKRCIKATSSHGGEQGRAEFYPSFPSSPVSDIEISSASKVGAKKEARYCWFMISCDTEALTRLSSTLPRRFFHGATVARFLPEWRRRWLTSTTNASG
ncbi:hypothetical protein HPP92_013448 [Vanilla planifolia]|uniref:Legume lectin domain-containing protein n=1 Tax=Vanilla planifolia TaxID=51239 RepID=A0A835QU27_VANPL|nr:hypothetical protein HPP92_013448 [Vanilla planifolia]